MINLLESSRLNAILSIELNPQFSLTVQREKIAADYKRGNYFSRRLCMLRYEIIAFSYAYVEISNTAPRSILRRTVPVLFVHALIPRYKHAKHDKFLQYKSMIISSLFLKSTCFTRRSDLLLTIVLLVTLRKPHRNNIATQTNTSDSNKNKREERRLHFR